MDPVCEYIECCVDAIVNDRDSDGLDGLLRLG